MRREPGQEADTAVATSEAVFRQILERFGQPLRRVAAAYEGDPALREDLFQEICLAVWKALGQFRAEASLATFVFRIAHNRGLTHASRRVRLRARETPSEESTNTQGTNTQGEPRDSGPTPEGSVLVRERSECLRSAVRRLPLGLRQVVALRLEGLKDEEISLVLGISTGNVAVRLTRARKALRELLG